MIGLKSSQKIAICVMVLCVVLAAAMMTTYALFSDGKTAENHIAAGSLKIELEQTAMTGNALAADGTMTEYDGFVGPVDLTESDAPVFELENICPTLWREATFEIGKGVSTVAFDSSVTVLKPVTGDAASEALLSQLKVTVSSGDGFADVTTFMLSEVGDEGKKVDLGTTLLTDSAPKQFKIKVEFVDSDDNNAAMTGSVSFDIVVLATQSIE